MSGETLPGPLVCEEYMAYAGAGNGEVLADPVGFPTATAALAALAEPTRRLTR
ncbi:hypothetical protein ACWDR1_00470 [Streptosporangium sandarakinum]